MAMGHMDPDLVFNDELTQVYEKPSLVDWWIKTIAWQFPKRVLLEQLYLKQGRNLPENIMELSIFLAKVIGWYFVITSVFTLTRQDAMKSLIGDIIAERALMFFIAVVTLILGLLLVLSHNVWLMGWPVMITIVAWLVLIAGLIRLFAPEYSIKMAQWWLRNPAYFITVTVICLLLGIYLLYMAYF